MHELGIAQEMLKIALEYAARNNARKITSLNIGMSAAADESDDSLRFHMENLTRGTLAEGARVEITRVPAEVECLDCGKRFAKHTPELGCPNCSGRRLNPLVRNEFRLTSIEVE
jgi:hydrogenase nickel incorporation protein HypA/HybF